MSPYRANPLQLLAEKAIHQLSDAKFAHIGTQTLRAAQHIILDFTKQCVESNFTIQKIVPLSTPQGTIDLYFQTQERTLILEADARLLDVQNSSVNILPKQTFPLGLDFLSGKKRNWLTKLAHKSHQFLVSIYIEKKLKCLKNKSASTKQLS